MSKKLIGFSIASTAAISFFLGMLFGESNDHQLLDLHLILPKYVSSDSTSPRIGPDADLNNIQINANSPLWVQNPAAATWFVSAESEEMLAVFDRQRGDIMSAQKHEANAKQDRDLARAALAKAD